jgi:UDP-N-acetylmuramoyl-L-alanyl-D-glutamate--2,6-diaminopimelate ligase
MGKISNELADISILTAEDPRTESLKDINDEIERGWREGKKKSELIRFDYDDKDVEVRKDAIKKALEIAQKDDTVIITGKAHEQSLCFGDIEYEWNDIEETEKLLSS